MFALCMTATAQTSASSTPGNQSPSVKTETAELKADVKQVRIDLAERQIARLVAEIKAGRALVASQRELVTKIEKQLADEQQNSASLSASYESAKREISANEETLKVKTELVEVLKVQRDKERKKVKRARRQQAGIAAGAVIGAATGGPLGAAIGAAAGWLVGIF